MKMLKDFGAGRSILEPKIRREARFLCDEITKYGGQPFDIKPFAHYAVANIIVEFVFGRRFAYDDSVYIDYLSTITYRLCESGVNGFSAFNFLPWLLDLPGLQNVKKVTADGVKVLRFLEECIRQKKSQLEETAHDDGSSTLDYVSAFMKARALGEGQYFHDDQLLIAVQQLFIAGSETTATTLRWALWYLCRRPDIQERIFDEIQRLTDGDATRPLAWAERKEMPFTEATICEVERIFPVFPFSVTHRTLTDTTLQGRRIPKDAYVIPLIWAVHRDPRYFPDPDEFRPERFLDADGKLVKNPAFMPFGIGKRAKVVCSGLRATSASTSFSGPRACLGESLAKMEVFLFLTALIQRFRFRFPHGAKVTGPKHVVGVVISPASFDIVAEERT